MQTKTGEAPAERFDDFYGAARPELVRFALRRARCAADAEDVVQHAALIAWTKWSSGPQPATASGKVQWLKEAIRKLFANRNRLAHVRYEVPAEEWPERSGVDVASAETAVLDQLPSYDWPSVAKSLTPRQRTLLQLLADGYSTNEIAEELGIAPSTLRGHLSQLRSRLENHGIRPSCSQVEHVDPGMSD
jgi:RNA polymerase sigma-70 factor, ECF subfamily